MGNLRRGQRGQALLLTTLSLFAMCGLMGLAVDLGYGYWVKKHAQTAVDAAALSTAYQAYANIGAAKAFPSSYTNAIAACPETGITALSNGCEYAQSDGFTAGGHSSRQNVTMISGVSSAPPTVPGVTADFWVTVRATETIPQLFSSLLGNTSSLSAARATAAVIPVIVNGNFIALDRSGDGLGSDITLKGHGDITAGQGIVVANNDTSGISTNGATSLVGPITQLYGSPAPTTPGACNTGTCTFQTQVDGTQFQDPMAGLGQPPLPSAPLNTYVVVGGDLSSSPIFQLTGTTNVANQATNYGGGGSPTLPSGNYVAASWAPGCGPGKCSSVNLSGNPLTISNAVTFSGSAFGTYMFYGGLSISSGSTLNMGAGEFVVVGGLTDDGILNNAAASGSAGQIIISTGTSGAVQGSFPNLTNTAAGNLYPGLITQLNSNQLLASMGSADDLAFAQTTLFKSADGTSDPSGLNPGGSGFPTSGTLTNPTGADISQFGGVVFWQDQANSAIAYTSSGNISGGVNSPNFTSYPTQPNINFHAQGDASMIGVFYQPRGASITSIGHGNTGDISGNLTIITGQFESNGGGGLNLSPIPIPLKKRIIALIE